MSIEDNYTGLDYINGTILIVTDDDDINIVLWRICIKWL